MSDQEAEEVVLCIELASQILTHLEERCNLLKKKVLIGELVDKFSIDKAEAKDIVEFFYSERS